MNLIVKICILGSLPVIKPHFLNFLSNDEHFRHDSGLDIFTREITVDDHPVEIITRNSRNQEFISPQLPPSLYRNASALILLFNKSVRKTFEDVVKWKEEFHKVIAKEVPTAIVGIFTSIEQITTKEGQQLAEKLHSLYFETDLTHQKRMLEILSALTREVIEYRKKFDT